MPSSTPSSSRIRLLVVRHGETDFNVRGVIQGQLNTEGCQLNAKGKAQAKVVAAALASEKIDEVYASPLGRAKETAEAIVDAHPTLSKEGSPFWLDDRLMERAFGTLQGHVYGAPGAKKRDSIEGIEQMRDFTERLASVLNDILSGPASSWSDEPTNPSRSGYKDSTRLARPSKHVSPITNGISGSAERTILLVGHGASISALLGDVMTEGGYATLAPGVQRCRVWNCSICEAIIDVSALPPSPEAAKRGWQAGHRELKSSWAVRPLHLRPPSTDPKAKGGKSMVFERWADVRHLPQNVDGEGVKNVDEDVAK